MGFDGQDRRLASDVLLKISTDIARMEERQEALHTQLLGNGQPGRIQIIETTQAKQGEAIDGVNKKIYWFAGGLAVASHFLKAALEKSLGIKF